MGFVVGTPGERGRVWIDSDKVELAESQLRPGEIIIEVATQPNGEIMSEAGLVPPDEGDE